MALNFRPTELSDSTKRYHCLQKETIPVLTYGTFEYRLPSDLFSFHRFVGFNKTMAPQKKLKNAKYCKTYSLEDGLALWNTRIQRLKDHIFAKRQQQSKISHLKTRQMKFSYMLITVRTIKVRIIMRSKVPILGSQPLAYSLPVLTTDANNQIPSKMPTTDTSEVSDKPRMASMTHVSKVIEHVVSQVPNKIDAMYIVSDGCASQFRSKFVFKLSTLIFPEMNIVAPQ